MLFFPPIIVNNYLISDLKAFLILSCIAMQLLENSCKIQNNQVYVSGKNPDSIQFSETLLK